MMNNTNEIILYQPDEAVRLEVMLNNDTVWLNRQQLATLFNRDVKTIGKHINNALKEELADIPTVAKFATVQDEGERLVERQITYYNLDMILSVGYRVKSDHGIKFRVWATGVHDRFLIIDDGVYHLGASVKDLGKKLFAFSKMGAYAEDIITHLSY